MPYSMHRIFCATPGDLEEERQAFYKVMGDFNAAEAMPQGILFVSVSLPATTTDKRPYQAVLSENIRACRYYILVLEDTWGPPQLNYERDYALATKCVTDPSLPMKQVAVLFKRPLLPHQVEPAVSELKQTLAAKEFDGLEEYQQRLWSLLCRWLPAVLAEVEG
jgi:hypothetical protein